MRVLWKKLLYPVMAETALITLVSACKLFGTARAAAVSSQQGQANRVITQPHSMYLVSSLSINKAANVLGADWKVEADESD